MDILSKIIPNPDIEMPLSVKYFDKVRKAIHEKEKGKWFITSFDSEGKDKQIWNEANDKKNPEEIVRQLFLIELIDYYGYPKDRIKTEQNISFGREKKRADIIVYQNDNITAWIVAEIKSPFEKNNPQQLKGYLNAEGSPIGVGFNGKNISRYFRPYPKEFDTLRDLPFEYEYQIAKDVDFPAQKIKELIAERKWTLTELNKLNEEKHFDLRAIIEELQELVLANSGFNGFDEIFKLIYAKLYDENEAENRDNQTLFFRDYANADITHKKISELFESSKEHWKTVFEASDKIKLSPNHLEVVIGKLTEVKLFGSNLRIIDEAFEFLMPEVAKGSKGQYFTPRVIIDVCVKMLNPSRREYILDPACGSAGFLVHAMEYVWDKYNLKTYRQQAEYAERYLWGIDFDEKASKISRAIMLIAGDGRTHIFQQNSLDHKAWSPMLYGELERFKLVENEKELKNLNFDVILTNPPFAGEIKEKPLINLYSDLLGLRYTYSMETSNIAAMLKSFAQEFNLKFADETEERIKDKIKEINKDDDIDLENSEDENKVIEEIASVLNECIEDGNYQETLIISRLRDILRFRKTESKSDKIDRHILFIQRIIDMLKPGGRTVIVLPQGIFNNTSEKYIRKFVTNKARLLGVVGLHGNSFKPHTGTKTSLLFLRKFTEEELNNNAAEKDYNIFFATQTISFKDNSGDYIFATDSEGNRCLDNHGNPLYYTDLYDIGQAFINFGIEQYENGDTAFSFLEDVKKKTVNIDYSVIKLSELGSDLRIDAEYFLKIYLKYLNEIRQKEHQKIKQFAFVTDGIHASIEFDETSNVNLVSAKAPKDNEFDLSKTGYISEKMHKKNPRTALRENDVIVSTVGTIGNCAVVNTSHLPANSDRHVGIIRILKDTVLPRFLSTFFVSKYGRAFTKRETAGNVQPNLYIRNINQLEIPIPSIEFQTIIENLVLKTEQERQKSQEHYRKAESILLTELGLNNWQPEKRKINIGTLEIETENTVNQISFSNLYNRFDAEFWQPKYENVVKIISKLEKQGKIKNLKLGSIFKVQRGIEVGGKAYSESGEILFLRISNISSQGLKFGADKFISNDYYKKIEKLHQPKNNEILFSKDGTAGIAYLFRDNLKVIPSGGILRLQNLTSNKLEYLELVLNSIVVQQQVLRMSSGALIQHLKLSEVSNLMLPLIEDKKQEIITDLIQKSFQSKNLCSKLLETAKKSVEIVIEKDEKTAIEYIKTQTI